jgi:hypothetical protein
MGTVCSCSKSANRVIMPVHESFKADHSMLEFRVSLKNFKGKNLLKVKLNFEEVLTRLLDRYEDYNRFL